MYLKIKSVADLSIDRLNELEKREKIVGITVLGSFKTSVSVSEYKQIYQKLLELTDGIEPDWSKTKKFVLIYKRVSSNIEYDYVAAYPEKGNYEQEEYSNKETNNCRNLKNGLLLGKCVCAGYAEILRNACLLKGINSIEILGPACGESHAWNQVEIDNGNWIEVDSTWDHKKGTENIGTNKQKFWETHGRYGIISILNSNEHIVSNFDLTAFINEEFELDMQYSMQEQNEFITLLDKRDAQGLDIRKELNELVERVYQRQKQEQEFEQECGYTIEQLKKLGFNEQEIKQMQTKFDGQTGVKLDRKVVVYQYITQVSKQKRDEQEFEQECGYTIEKLKELGFDEQEIKQMQAKFDGQTGVKLDRKEIIEKKITERNVKTTKVPVVVLTKEKKENLELKCKDLHPDALTGLIKEIEEGYILLEDAYSIINYIKGIESRTTVNAILTRRSINKQRKDTQEFESECGYTIEQLIEFGFTETEIEQMQAKFDGQTGEKIDRKKVVENTIINRRNKNWITLQEIGQGTIEDFKNNTGEAIKAIKDLERGIKISYKTNDEIIKGED